MHFRRKWRLWSFEYNTLAICTQICKNRSSDYNCKLLHLLQPNWASQLDLRDSIQALARDTALACKPNADRTTGPPVAAAGKDRGFCILVQAVPIFEAHWTKRPVIHCIPRPIQDIYTTRPSRPLFFAVTSLIPAAFSPECRFSGRLDTSLMKTRTHSFCLSTIPLTPSFQRDAAIQLLRRAQTALASRVGTLPYCSMSMTTHCNDFMKAFGFHAVTCQLQEGQWQQIHNMGRTSLT